MPLKPMFSRAPLTMQPLAPLAPEAIALEGSARETAGEAMRAGLAGAHGTCPGGRRPGMRLFM